MRRVMCSICVLLWEISSGIPPFHTNDEQNNIGLIYNISQGQREKIIPDTSVDYANLYTGKYFVNNNLLL